MRLNFEGNRGNGACKTSPMATTVAGDFFTKPTIASLKRLHGGLQPPTQERENGVVILKDVIKGKLTC